MSVVSEGWCRLFVPAIDPKVGERRGLEGERVLVCLRLHTFVQMRLCLVYNFREEQAVSSCFRGELIGFR